MKKEKQGDGDLDGELPYFDGEEFDEQQNYDDTLCQEIDFGSETNSDDDNGKTIKGAA